MKRSTFVLSGAAAGLAAAAPRFAVAAGPAATVKIGFLDSFTGVFSDLGAYHRAGALLALEDANRRGRVKYEFSFADDASKPAIATSEARRLATQEKVDVLFGGVSSANGLALSPLALELGIFNLEIGPQDSSITGAKAGKLTYRFGPNARMLFAPLLRRALALGRKWYFIQADYALGRDGYQQLSDALKRAGGTEVGHDIVPLGTSDFSSVLTKVRNSGADVLILANSGLDAANTAKQFVDFGLNKKMKLAGIALEDIYYKAIPLDAIAGATFPVIWTPSVSGEREEARCPPRARHPRPDLQPPLPWLRSPHGAGRPDRSRRHDGPREARRRVRQPQLRRRKGLEGNVARVRPPSDPGHLRRRRRPVEDVRQDASDVRRGRRGARTRVRRQLRLALGEGRDHGDGRPEDRRSRGVYAQARVASTVGHPIDGRDCGCLYVRAGSELRCFARCAAHGPSFLDLPDGTGVFEPELVQTLVDADAGVVLLYAPVLPETEAFRKIRELRRLREDNSRSRQVQNGSMKR